MTARLRIVVAVAILFALAAHPIVHPLVKECPCVHATAIAVTAVTETVPAVHGEAEFDEPRMIAESNVAPTSASRAPPRS